MTTHGLYIDGAHVEGTGGETSVRNPANGGEIARVARASAADVDRAVTLAHERYQAGVWRRAPVRERRDVLRRIADLVRRDTERLAQMESQNAGKPISAARGEIGAVAASFDYYAGAVDKFGGETLPGQAAGTLLTFREPIGVCAAITPWNFPNAMITRKCAPALAAGCTVVIKPSELTPFSALALGVLAERAGFPPGVINIVTGQPGPIGEAMTSSEVVRKLSFTGSTRVGRYLMEKSAGTLKRLSLELGGNAPFIVFDDADLDKALKGVMASKFRNAGQTCVCANRILVQDSIYDEFAARLTRQVSGLVVGNGLDEKVTIGPLINDAAVEKVLGHVEDARAHGAIATIGGGAHALGGHFVAPTVLTGMTPAMRAGSEETFGPVAPLFRFGTDDEALEIANGTAFGLAAYYYTENLRRSWRVAERLEFGMVGLNTGSISVETAPFGGVKQSGFGREGSHYGIDEYLQIKAFHLGDIG